LRRTSRSSHSEPIIPGATPSTTSEFFDALRMYMPRESFLTTDSGLHQILARRYFRVLAARGLIVPSDFQSMGFGLAAAIGAKMACPDRLGVALIGDGGLLMSGTELSTAVRERLALTVIVFSDGHLGLIRAQQLSEYGHAHGTRLLRPDWELFARAFGATYARLDGAAAETIPRVLKSRGVCLLEVPLEDPPGAELRRRLGRAVRTFRGTGFAARQHLARDRRASNGE
jgi:thiamine pyrophosphate-dependent acetolactate synthase large subunit-like protein